MRRLIIILVSICSFITSGQEQESFNITGGAGLLELFHIGGRFQLDQSELGFNIGTVPSPDEDIISLQANYLYHFGGSSDLSARRPWYLRGGFTFIRSDTEFELTKYSIVDLRIGRDFNFSEKFGVQIDLGPAYVISEDVREKQDTDDFWFFFDIDLENEVLPVICFTFYYRI
ncbi:hypothetical protein GCM10023115_34200 [Pontixanthobacter gangjinensis]|uniref:Porin family protein n=1 Tax=Christiangramia aestuarii TaxID=1028746 RepID=A0A7K1LS29_9FLAO|nr:hypothetical protein [Christiangramia aestuarii]MUP43411.1 hypothetical protein [Christiangramia aestuarii]